ncbi:hypothetical protein [Neobacillus dielmonensis]|uniref:hypothetical protein n=1 Tax=Neobacillus dielmonensis TaxID=1347369 RepID=UPI0018A7EC72|nr:hypothetical protein [Neobacillus dielmonensis]
MDDPKRKYTFDFDERGTKEVSDQIMNSYNLGFIDQGTAPQLQGGIEATADGAD